MTASGFTVSPPDLTVLAGDFAAAVSPLARQVETIVADLGIDTGNAALNARIATLLGQVTDSVAGAGMALQLDSDNLNANAKTFTAADQASIPPGVQ